MNTKAFILCLFLGMLIISTTATDLSKQDAKADGSAAEESKTTTSGWGGGGGGSGGGGWGGGGGGHGGGCHKQCCRGHNCWCC